LGTENIKRHLFDFIETFVAKAFSDLWSGPMVEDVTLRSEIDGTATKCQVDHAGSKLRKGQETFF
jgi:hypothetical protein